MEDYEQELAHELAHYHDVLAVIHKQLHAARNDQTKSEAILQETNKDMWENASHSSDDFDRAVELSQFCQPLAGNAAAVRSAEQRIRSLERMEQSAYHRSAEGKHPKRDRIKERITGCLKCANMTRDLKKKQ